MLKNMKKDIFYQKVKKDVYFSMHPGFYMGTILSLLYYLKNSMTIVKKNR